MRPIAASTPKRWNSVPDAATICLEECGAVVTDAYGESLASRPLLGSDHEFQMSCIAAANRDLHSAICAEIDAGIERLRATGS